MKFIFSRKPKFLENLFCGCGKPATVGWHLPVDNTVKPVKLSKTNTDDVEVIPKKGGEKKEPQPYGWACDPHVPPELVPFVLPVEVPGAGTSSS